MNFIRSQVQYVAYANDFAALKPEWWALESLAVLEENLVVAGLVRRDFDDFFVNAGDTVHVNKPGTFVTNHKTRTGTTTVQDATATDTLVKLDQHLEVTTHLTDREMKDSLPDIREYVLGPMLRGLIEGIDGAIVGEGNNFHLNAAGEAASALSASDLIELQKVQNELKVPFADRNLVVGPSGYADLLSIDRFSDADKRGSQSLLINGYIGQVMGYEVFMSQTVGRSFTPNTTTAETTNGGESKGATSITIDSALAGHTVGTWVTVAGAPGAYRLTAAISATNTEAAITPGLRAAVADGVSVTFYESAGEVKGAHTADGDLIKIVTDTYAAATEIPQVGQGITFGASASAAVYTVTRVEGTWASSATEITLTLNRPLEASLGDNDAINVMPNGSANMAFRPDAITLVNRPLAPANQGTGVASAVQSANGLSIRATIGYDMDVMKHKITLDTLIGVKTLDADQGALLYGV